jgi:hypothetical protein
MRVKIFTAAVMISITLVSLALAAAAAPAVRPGVYTLLSNGVMEGEFELRIAGNFYEATVNLVQPDSGHVAIFAGPAVIAGDKVVIESTEGDGAEITVTLTGGLAVVEANEKAEEYHGSHATFNGTYICRPVKERTRSK